MYYTELQIWVLIAIAMAFGVIMGAVIGALFKEEVLDSKTKQEH